MNTINYEEDLLHRRVFQMKIVVVKPPKVISSIFRFIFGIKKEKE